MTSTSEKNVSARTSASGTPCRSASEVDDGDQRKSKGTLHEAPPDQVAGKQRLIGRARGTTHDVVLFRFRFEHERADRDR